MNPLNKLHSVMFDFFSFFLQNTAKTEYKLILVLIVPFFRTYHFPADCKQCKTLKKKTFIKVKKNKTLKNKTRPTTTTNIQQSTALKMMDDDSGIPPSMIRTYDAM
jgi:hypothetical protein